MKKAIVARRNQYRVQGAMGYLTIIRKDGEEHVVKFDAVDLERVRLGVWHIVTGRGDAYVATKEKGGRLQLSHFLMAPATGNVIYYENHDPLDCRRSNLGEGPKLDLSRRRRYRNPLPGRRSPAVPYMYCDNRPKTWMTYISVAGKKKKYVGSFPDLADAIAAQRQAEQDARS